MRLRLAAGALLLVTACRPPAPVPDGPTADAKLTLGIETAPERVQPDYAAFASGTNFRLRMMAASELYVYPFRWENGAWRVLAKEMKLAQYQPTTLPAGNDWLRFGAEKGHEQLVLVLAPMRLPEMAALQGAVSAEQAEKLWAKIELDYRPNGLRHYEEQPGPQMATTFFGRAGRIAAVLRVPLFHQ